MPLIAQLLCLVPVLVSYVLVASSVAWAIATTRQVLFTDLALLAGSGAVAALTFWGVTA